MGHGECKIEELDDKCGISLEQFFLDLQKQNATEEEKQEDKLDAKRREMLRRKEARRTVQIRNTSEMLPTHFRTDPNRDRATTSIATTDVTELEEKISINNAKKSSKPKVTRTISSKSLKRTLSIGKFTRSDKISKSASKEEISEAPPPPTIVKSKTSDRLKDFSDFMKRTTRSPSARRSAKKKKKGSTLTV